MSPKSILYVEDQAEEVEETVDQLKHEFGINVDLASDIPSAIEKLSQTGYGLVIIDIMMDPNKPILWEQSGFVIIERIQGGDFENAGNAKDMPIILATAVWDSYVQKRDGSAILVAEAQKQLDMSDEMFVGKPWPPNGKGSLISTVSKMLGIHPASWT